MTTSSQTRLSCSHVLSKNQSLSGDRMKVGENITRMGKTASEALSNGWTTAAGSRATRYTHAPPTCSCLPPFHPPHCSMSSRVMHAVPRRVTDPLTQLLENTDPPPLFRPVPMRSLPESGSTAKQNKLSTLASRGPVVPLSSSNYTRYAEGGRSTRPYHLVMLFTSSAPEHNCMACR